MKIFLINIKKIKKKVVFDQIWNDHTTKPWFILLNNAVLWGAVDKIDFIALKVNYLPIKTN